jgi:hypothetical protein
MGRNRTVAAGSKRPEAAVSDTYRQEMVTANYPIEKDEMKSKLVRLLFGISLVAVVQLSVANDKFALSRGTYRIEGTCERTVFLGADATPICKSFAGIDAKNPDAPIFIFPLEGSAWFFVSSGMVAVSADNAVATYKIYKLFDQMLNAEFSYNNGECEFSMKDTAPAIRCTLWKGNEKSTIAREISFVGSGTWQFSKK